VGVPLGDFERYESRQRSFESIGGYFGGTGTIAGGDRPDRIGVARMTAGGVTFVTAPRTEPYGQVAVFLDIAGNRWDLLGPAAL